MNFKDTFFSPKLTITCHGRLIDFSVPRVMGILNVTPDSFSDGGKFSDKDKAVDYAIEMIEAGADIIDVGGESTRPGSESVIESEELNRVIPVITEILKKKRDAVISIDTTKTKIAEEALKCGALIVNDISGGTFDNNIFNVVKDFNAAMVLMHMKGNPKNMQVDPTYGALIPEIMDYFRSSVQLATRSGIPDNMIILDPGIGFGKTFEHNLEIINNLDQFSILEKPLLIGPSRKAFLGKILEFPLRARSRQKKGAAWLWGSSVHGRRWQ